VAQRTGYASEFAFAKAFKREYGVAPGQYRRRVLPAAAPPGPVSVPERRNAVEPADGLLEGG
jgi:AraC-like DNA-binding protein